MITYSGVNCLKAAITFKAALEYNFRGVKNVISARLDCVENLTRQRHDRDQTENQQNAATVDWLIVDSRFGLYHVAVVLSFLRSPALQKFESFIFLAD